MLNYLLLEGGEKIILSAVAITMLLSNVAFASTRTSNTNCDKDSNKVIVQKEHVIKLTTQDPRG